MELDRLPKQPEHIGIVVADMEKARAEIRALYGPLPGLDLSLIHIFNVYLRGFMLP